MGCISGHQEGERVEEGNGDEGVWRGQTRGGCRGRDGTGREGRKEGRMDVWRAGHCKEVSKDGNNMKDGVAEGMMDEVRGKDRRIDG